MKKNSKKFLSISEAAEYMGLSITTLRRWDKNGSFRPTFISPGGHRYYVISDLDKKTKGLFRLAKEWVSATEPHTPAEEFYCATNDIFRARLDRMAHELAGKAAIRENAPLLSAVAGEIGNNSYDHNLGNWPDIPGTFFAYDLGKKLMVLADRGRGVLATLKRIRPELQTDAEALSTAFTEIISGRAPEHRGNGLKFVREAVIRTRSRLKFQSGSAELEISSGDSAFKISTIDTSIHGCLAMIEF